MADDGENSSYAKLGRELWRRTKDPLFQPPFVFYVLTGVVLFGGLGIWVELVKLYLPGSTGNPEALVTAVITFFSTLAGAATIQLNYSSYQEPNKNLGSFALLLMCLFAGAALLLALFGPTHPECVLHLGLVCSIVAIWVWWITNGDEPTFREMKKDDDAAVGGDPKRDLPGDLGEFVSNAIRNCPLCVMKNCPHPRVHDVGSGLAPPLTGRREAEPTGGPSAAGGLMRPLFRLARSR